MSEPVSTESLHLLSVPATKCLHVISSVLILIHNNHVAQYLSIEFFTGPIIPFDLNGVWPLPENPKLTDYPSGSRARMLAEDFCRLYLQTLHELQNAFDGNPQLLPTAVANMFLLKIKAREMVQTQVQPGLNAGPTFENPLRVGRDQTKQV